MCLGKEEAELGKVWNAVLGRYDTAMLNLVIDMLRESQNPEEKLSNALSEMRTPESAAQASKAIHKGKLEQQSQYLCELIILNVLVLQTGIIIIVNVLHLPSYR